MKAILLNDFGNTDNFVLTENYPKPTPGEGEVLVQIKAVGFNPVDYQMRQGKILKDRIPSKILGREFSGIIVNVGKNVYKFDVGDAVFAASGSMGSNGTYAQYIAVPVSILAKKPPGISFEEAAAIPIAYLTALQTFNRLQIKKGESVFIGGGAGGVGLALVKLLLGTGIDTIVTTAGNEESRQRLLDAGLPGDRIIDYRDKSVQTRIVTANKNILFAHCIDLVGAEMSEVSAKVLAINGNYADVTAFSTLFAREILFDKGACIFNISNYAYSLSGDLFYYGNSLGEIARLLKNRFITPPALQIIGELNVATVVTAHQMLEANLTHGKKLVMKVSVSLSWITFFWRFIHADFISLYRYIPVFK